MLSSLTISQFTLVEYLDVEFRPGMTAITGETGAGKSLVVDALGLALGDRGDTDQIRQGAAQMEVCAGFDVDNNAPALNWLAEHDLSDGNACLCRRTLSREGRSRGYINGQPATMSQLREFGALVIDIHNQHEHQSLLQKNHQRVLLDEYAGHVAQVNSLAEVYRQWRTLEEKLLDIRARGDQAAAEQELLTFQLEELRELGLAKGEIEQLEEEQTLLAHAEEIAQACRQALNLCDDSDTPEQPGASGMLRKAGTLLQALPQHSPALAQALDMLDSAAIQVAEACREMGHHLDTHHADPARLQQLETRLSEAYQIARKHKVQADELPALTTRLTQELESIATTEDNLTAMADEVKALKAEYFSQAEALSQKRKKAAKTFAQKVNAQLVELAMATASIKISLEPLAQGTAWGLESVEILISTNPGQPHRPLEKIASGGELSRVSLAIQVVAAEHCQIPVLVFDEVDVGIGGATADVVGRLLRKLGETGQVICISHQPQVAAHAQHHWRASKSPGKSSVESALIALDAAARVEEIARMLGGEKITKTTISHAEEMLAAGTG